MTVPGTAGYSADDDVLFDAFERITFTDVHAHALHLMPSPPARVLDIGAGSGRDAAELAALGHSVVAVEPTAALRERAIDRHASPRITWLDDALPALARLAGANSFDLVLLSAVWMHLDAAARSLAMARVAELTRAGGVVLLSLRHGPVPAGRVMFEVSAEETMALANAVGLATAMRLDDQPAASGRANVRWSRLALIRTD